MTTRTALTVLAACGTITGAHGQTHTVTRLVDVPGVTQSWALDVNASAQIAGSYVSDGWKRTNGFIWEGGEIVEHIVPRPSPRGATPPQPRRPAHHVDLAAISDGGVVAVNAGLVDFGFFYTTCFTPIPATATPPKLFSAAVVNDPVAADIVGADPEGDMLIVGWGYLFENGMFPRRAYAAVARLDDGVGDPPRRELIAGLGDPESGATAWAANSEWTIVGGQETASGDLVAYVRDWEQKVEVPLGTLGGPSSEALDINDAGQIVGWAQTAPGIQHAFLYENGQMRDLGTLGGPTSTALGINDHGFVVGESWTMDGRVHAFLHNGESMIDLNDAIAPGSGWVLQRAHAINDAGWIVGEGWINGESHAFLLEPVCRVDLTGEGRLDIFDFLAFQDLFVSGDPRADFTGDGVLDVFDFLAFQDEFVAGCP